MLEMWPSARFVLAVSLLMGCATPACAEHSWQRQSTLSARPLTERLPFTTALEQAWQLDPSQRELQTNRKGAQARARAADSWFAGGPTVTGNYFDDHAIGSNQGYTTYQGEVSIPLWLPGQGSATRSVAQAEAESAEKRSMVAHMSLAVRLLDTTAAALLAQKHLATAQAYTASAAQISRDVAQATRAGEMTLSDQHQADAALDTARLDSTAAQEEVQTALAGLNALLGSASIPDIQTYTATDSALNRISALTSVEAHDPRIQAARKEVDAAQAALKLARRSFMPNPEIGVGAIHEKQYASPWDNRVGVTFSVPLPSSVHNAPLLAAAKDRAAAADRQEALAHRMVRQEAAQIRARLVSATTSLNDASSAATHLQNRAALLERSWKLRETPLDDVMRARQAAYGAALARDRAEIVWHAAIVRALIASHTLPGLTTGLAQSSDTHPASPSAAWATNSSGNTALTIPASLDTGDP
ncbi:TolC family protein [Acetobacter cibinongensis]|uniref:TolC family protein n=1 Tax=Acetobacter cibinongensis TaxID=146475 RepID=UPI000A3836B1|nr:TolC family protein [Acetobacter cibinongensis]